MKQFFLFFITLPFVYAAQMHAKDDLPQCGCGNFYIAADYLYWKAHEEGLDYAIDGIGPHEGGVPETEPGNTKHLHWDANSGYRIHVGYSFPCPCWDASINYTRWTGKATDSVTGPTSVSEATLWATFSAPRGGEVFFFGDADWKLHFQTLDLEIGRFFCFGKCFIFRFYGGLKGIWTSEDYKILYDDRPVISFFHLIQHEQDFSGLGPRVGFLSNWKVFRCLSLFTDTSFTLAWGHFDVKREDNINNIEAVDTGDDFYALRPMFDFKIGVQWDTCLKNCYNFFATVAFEGIIFLKHNQYIQFMSGVNSDPATVSRGVFQKLNTDLSLYGLTVSAGMVF